MPVAEYKRCRIAGTLHVVGEESLQVYTTFTRDSATDNQDYDKVIAKFQDCCTPQKNALHQTIALDVPLSILFCLSQNSVCVSLINVLWNASLVLCLS